MGGCTLDRQGRGTVPAPEMGTPAAERASVTAYYRANQLFYDRFWTEPETLSLNYGLWSRRTTSRSGAFRNQNQLLARALRCGSEARVLEAGCGTGGTSIWLAQTLGVETVGITLCRHQASLARVYSQRRRVQDRTHFLVMDFLATGFVDGSFSRIFASESACYAQNKLAFAREAFRVLDGNGRLVIVDGFLTSTTLSESDQRLYEAWRSGWAVGALCTASQFQADLRSCGFTNIRFRDLTRLVLPSSRLLCWRGILGLPLLRTLSLLRVCSSLHTNNALSSIYQWLLFQRRLARYGLLICDKQTPQRAGREAKWNA
jgi:cyclopropane fatty-acyl-phospholipid synthase-like methyltransferase